MRTRCIHWIKSKIFKEIIHLIKIHLDQIHLDFRFKVLIQQHKDIQIMIYWEEVLNGMLNWFTIRFLLNYFFFTNPDPTHARLKSRH